MLPRFQRKSSMRVPWLLILTLCFFSHASAIKHGKKKLPSAVVVGTVYCDTCFSKELIKTSHFHSISGASIAVECGKMGLKSGFRLEAKTDEHGEFKVRLPFAVREHVERIKRCQVKLISSNEPSCSVISMATSSSLRLKSRNEGIHIFSSGLFTFRPLKRPELCYQKQNELPNVSGVVPDKKLVHPDLFFPPPTIPFLPSPPPFGLPLPPLPFFQPPPPLINLPPIPFLTPSPPPPFFNLPPLPFFTPPPSPPPFFNLPPLPFFTPPPSPPPPFFHLPPLPPLPSLPPLPFLTPPPPPPPPPPVFPFPPFHFPPLPPLFPGIPPASPSKKTSP